MKCADEYVLKCIDVKEAKIIENELYGAKKFFKKLCDDKIFQIGIRNLSFRRRM